MIYPNNLPKNKTKKCLHCSKAVDIYDFFCSFECRKDRSRSNALIYYKTNRKKILDYHRAWYKNNKERIIEYNKKYFNKNKEIINKKKRLKYHSPEGKLYRRNYHIKNAERKSVYSFFYYIQKKTNKILENEEI